jgi:DNA-damage-inducible protein J
MELVETLPESEQEFVYQFVQKIAKGYPKASPKKSCPKRLTKAESDALFYSESNMAHLMRGIEQLNAGKGVEHEIIEV